MSEESCSQSTLGFTEDYAKVSVTSESTLFEITISQNLSIPA